MFASMEKKTCHPWWLDSHNNARRSTWLQSTVSELDEKTMRMLKLIEEDADSFAQRAEMYYKKRPQLINMVEDFYRSHRSLAERFDMLKSEPRTRFIRSMSSPLSTKCQLNKSRGPMEKSNDSYSETYSPLSTKCQLNKLMAPMEKSYDSYSDAYSESGESEVDDPEHDEEIQVDRKIAEDEEDSAESEVDDPEQEDAQVDRLDGVVNMVNESEVKKLRDEIERLKEENRIQKEQLMQKDEEKREVIRQLSLSMEILKENASLCKRRTASAKELSKKWGPFEFNKGKGLFSVKLFGVPSKPEAYNMVEF